VTNSILVSKEDSFLRIDKLLALRFPSYSRTYFQYLIEKGAILLNEKPIKKRLVAQEGDLLSIDFLASPEISLEPEAIDLEILYEDADLLAINKPAGMVVHPAVGHPKGTLVNALLHYCQEGLPPTDAIRPGIVHRLDKETSGILIAAKTERAHRELVSIFSRRTVKKLYYALCFGNPGEVTIEAPIGRSQKNRKEMAVVESGKPATSRCRIVLEKKPFSLVEVEIVTGRTHQIRVHLQHVGCPVVGDATYGNTTINKKYGIPHQLLHAHLLEMTHPITGAPLKIKAKPPEIMIKFIDSYIGDPIQLQ